MSNTIVSYNGVRDPELARIMRGRSRLGVSAPGYASLLFKMILVELTGDEVKTMATDGTHMFWNRDFVRSITDAELVTVLLHEALHILFGHHLRRGSFDPDIWNIAADHVINLTIVKARRHGFKFTFPGNPYCDEIYAGMTAQQVARLLTQPVVDLPMPPQPSPDSDGDSTDDKSPPPPGTLPGEDEDGEDEDGKDGDADGKGGDEDGKDDKPGADGPVGQPKNFDHAGEVWDAVNPETGEPLNEKEIAGRCVELQRDVLVAAMAEKAAGSGTLMMDDGVVKAAAAPSVNWVEEMADFLVRTNGQEPTMARPNRRYIGMGEYFPSSIGVGGGDLVISIDISSSVNTKEREQFVAEIDEIRETIQPDRTIVMYFNATIVKGEDGAMYDEFMAGEDIVVRSQRGGGTRFDPQFNLVRHADIEPSALICLTDGEASVSEDVGNEVDYPVLWATTSRKPIFFGEEFGEVVEVTFN